MTSSAEKDVEYAAISACVVCGHRVVWHHDDRGCQFSGNGPFRCACRRNCDQVVAGIIREAFGQTADSWFDACVTGTRPLPPGSGRA